MLKGTEVKKNQNWIGKLPQYNYFNLKRNNLNDKPILYPISNYTKVTFFVLPNFFLLHCDQIKLFQNFIEWVIYQSKKKWYKHKE